MAFESDFSFIVLLLSFLLLLETLSIFALKFYNFLKLLLATKPLDLKSKYGDWAVITGSSEGIGKAYAIELAKLDINLVLISLNKLDEAKSEIKKINRNIEIETIEVDLLNGKQVYDQIEEKLKHIPVGILVNNVGKFCDLPRILEEMSEKDISDIISLNIGAVTFMTRMVIADMKKRNKGAIVNIASAAGHLPVPYMSIYCATKAYVRNFSETIKLECYNHGITVQCISPFFVSTAMTSISSLLTHKNLLVPSAKMFVRSAIKTLGRTDATSGYLLHEIIMLFIVSTPFWIRNIATVKLSGLLVSDCIRKQKKELEIDISIHQNMPGSSDGLLDIDSLAFNLLKSKVFILKNPSISLLLT